MDLGDYWQENKRFVTGVGAGVVVFLIGFALVRSYFEGDIQSKRREIGKRESDLAQPMFSATELADAQAQHDALTAAVAELTEAARFEPRPEFVIDPSRGAANAQYLRALSRVREGLLLRANRANVGMDPSLGLPALSPTREAEIERYLEALDVVETVSDIAIDARVDRVERIRIKLDPGLHSREGLGSVERTLVTFSMTGTSLALTRVLTWTQRPRERGDGTRPPVLHLDGLEIVPSRSKQDEVRMEVTVVIARIPETEDVS